ncbi:MAG: hypothetical protein U9P14_06250, partial [Gemmatimonadota bacterium]|nr:hypothetical protein [Gemmatimonadota bacterium]
GMLGQDRPWPKEPPACRVARRIQRRDYVVECLVLETGPGIYATANFYIPRSGKGPYPVIIYQSGHSGMGIYGNKTKFKHHGAWFAARGICVLILDTIELGELKVTHHGVYSNQWYDWYSCGYSPLAAEVYNARRVIDYLGTRREVDIEKVGATGISGGGVCTFFLTLLDERVKAAAPVSGVCSSEGQIAGRLAVLHCDCMYPVNSGGLLFAEMGALAAPRPFLLCNADQDPLFPQPYFEQLVGKMGDIYRLYGAESELRTAVVPGGHADSEAIRLPVYAFFFKEFLGIDTVFTEHGAVDTLPNEELVCMRGGFPLDERLTRVHEEFMPRACFIQGAAPGRLSELSGILRREVFNFFPETETPFEPQWEDGSPVSGRSIKNVSYNSPFGDLKVKGIYSLPPGSGGREKKLPAVLVLQEPWYQNQWWGGYTRAEGYDWSERAVLVIETLDIGSRAVDDSLRHQMIRQANIAGFSFDGMRVCEILRSLEFLRTLPEVDPEGITVLGAGAMGINGLYAAFLDGRVERVVLREPVGSHLEGPYYLGILTHTDIPEIVSLMAHRVRVLGSAPLEIAEALEEAMQGKAFQFPNIEGCLE